MNFYLIIICNKYYLFLLNFFYTSFLIFKNIVFFNFFIIYLNFIFTHLVLWGKTTWKNNLIFPLFQRTNKAKERGDSVVLIDLKPIK